MGRSNVARITAKREFAIVAGLARVPGARTTSSLRFLLKLYCQPYKPSHHFCARFLLKLYYQPYKLLHHFLACFLVSGPSAGVPLPRSLARFRKLSQTPSHHSRTAFSPNLDTLQSLGEGLVTDLSVQAALTYSFQRLR